MGNHRDLVIVSEHVTYLQLSVGIMTFFPNRTQKVIDIYPKVTNCSFIHLCIDFVVYKISPVHLNNTHEINQK